MRRTLFFAAALLAAAFGLGATAVAQNAKYTHAAPDTMAATHIERGVKCDKCHEAGKPQTASTFKCLTCHRDGASVARRTAKTKPTNPHDNRHYGTEADCALCHHEHKPSENNCLQCHHTFKFSVP